jgi:hypothetical protein
VRYLLALAIGCASAKPEPPPASGPARLPPEAQAAEDALAAALVDRDPAVVSEKARAAAQWEGKDRGLDLLLADALANVLMRPAEADPIIARWPPSDAPDYRTLVLGKALRSSDWTTLARLLPGVPVDNPVRDQLAIRARRDPRFFEEGFVRALQACALLDRQPPYGRREIDIPVPEDMLEAVAVWGAPQFAVGRASQEVDPLPERGEDPIKCRRMRWLDVDRLPLMASHSLTLAVSDGTHDVYIEIKTEQGALWAWASNDPAAAGRIVDAARIYGEASGEEAGRAAMITKYGPYAQ